MKTKLIYSVDEASKILEGGDVVAIPTETVYGLAADALNSEAVKKIFQVKERPADNPLIVHISEFEDLGKFVLEVPKKAELLCDKFWPGPLTMIFKKKDIIPNIVTANLGCVAIRMPSLEITRQLISKLGRPLAAPSANISGRPSPTSYAHVLNDLDGKISAILVGEDCSVGVESTVIDVTSNPIRLLRPGKISPEEISDSICEKVIVDDSVNHSVSDLKEVRSPGVKYKHYSPKTKVVLVKGTSQQFAQFVNSQYNCVSVCFEEDISLIYGNKLSYGSVFSESDQLKFLFDRLRKVDSFNLDVAYVHLSSEVKQNLAVLNRLFRASGFNILELN